MNVAKECHTIANTLLPHPKTWVEIILIYVLYIFYYFYYNQQMHS